VELVMEPSMKTFVSILLEDAAEYFLFLAAVLLTIALMMSRGT
jgi:hypothetical protein